MRISLFITIFTIFLTFLPSDTLAAPCRYVVCVTSVDNGVVGTVSNTRQVPFNTDYNLDGSFSNVNVEDRGIGPGINPLAGERVPYQAMVGIPNVDENNLDIESYLGGIYWLAIFVAASLAVLKIVVAGVKYVGSDIVTSKETAKKDIWGALFGLTIVLAAVIILNTVNDRLTNFDIFANARNEEAGQARAGASGVEAQSSNAFVLTCGDNSGISCTNKKPGGFISADYAELGSTIADSDSAAAQAARENNEAGNDAKKSEATNNVNQAANDTYEGNKASLTANSQRAGSGSEGGSNTGTGEWSGKAAGFSWCSPGLKNPCASGSFSTIERSCTQNSQEYELTYVCN